MDLCFPFSWADTRSGIARSCGHSTFNILSPAHLSPAVWKDGGWTVMPLLPSAGGFWAGKWDLEGAASETFLPGASLGRRAEPRASNPL